ncbi:hypothetical protein RSOL_338650, partial [Rhizoctonia solani AG-3 Rhs1AP]
MPDKHKNQKKRVVPPTAPKSHTSRLLVKTGHRVQAQSASDVTNEQTPSSGKSASLTRTYPSPGPTVRKSVPRGESADPHLNRLPLLDFGAASTLRSPSQSIANPTLSDSDDARIGKKASPKNKRRKLELSSEADDSEDNANVDARSKAKRVKGKSKVPLESDMDLEDGENEGSDEDEDEGSDEDEDGNEDEDDGSTGSDEDEDAGPLTKSGVQANVQKGDMIQAHYQKARRAHALKIMLDMCALNHAQEAGKLEFPCDASGNPLHFVNNILVPHLNREFKKEWDIWGDRFVKLFKDSSRMPSDCDPIMTATNTNIRDAVRVGVWGTMRLAYRDYQTGNGEKLLEGRRSTSRNWQYRTTKGEHRQKALDLSSLPSKGLEFVGDPNFQSDEEIDPEDSKHRFVKVPEYRTEECTTFLGALDVAFEEFRPTRRNQMPIKRTYRKVNVEVPKLRSGDVPQWIVRREWENANPDLEQISRQRIDLKMTEVPNANAFRDFIHRYEPKKRIYSPSVSRPAVIATPVTAGAHPTAVDNVMHDDGPAAASNILLPATLGLIAPTGPSGVTPGVPVVASVEPSAPTSTTAPSEPHRFAPFPLPPNPPNSVQPPPGLNFSPAYTQFSHNQVVPGPPHINASGPGHYQLPGNQALGPPQFNDAPGHGGQQGAEVQVAHADFPLDPNLENSLTHSLWSNEMPPPPEIVRSTPELPRVESAPPIKAKNTEKKASKGGKASKNVRGKVKVKPKKSKEVIEEDDKQDEADEAVSGPSHLPRNAGNPSRLRLNVKGG